MLVLQCQIGSIIMALLPFQVILLFRSYTKESLLLFSLLAYKFICVHTKVVDRESEEVLSRFIAVLGDQQNTFQIWGRGVLNLYW